MSAACFLLPLLSRSPRGALAAACRTDCDECTCDAHLHIAYKSDAW
jgi:hypothetical protein